MYIILLHWYRICVLHTCYLWCSGTGYVCCTRVTFEYLLVCTGVCETSKQGMFYICL